MVFVEKILFVEDSITKEKVNDNELLVDGLNISSNAIIWLNKIIDSSANSLNSNKILIALFF